MSFTNKLFARVIQRAKKGKPNLFSQMMQEIVPFNRPHRISVIKISAQGCTVAIPERRRNLNHLGTMHACAIAAAGEYVSGLNVIEAFDISKYRLIMSRLEVDYLKRPSGSCTANSSWPKEMLVALKTSLKSDGVATFAMTSKLTDSKSKHVATTTTHWQVKSWEKVRGRSQA